MSKIRFFYIFLLIISLNLSAYWHRFTNDTNEVVDVEFNLSGLHRNQNRIAEKFQPGESREVETFGAYCLVGINIWRTYWDRDWQGLLGTWEYGKGYDPVFGVGSATSSGAPCASNEWVLTYKEDSPLRNLTIPKHIQSVPTLNKTEKKLHTIKPILQANDGKLLKEGAGYELIHKGSDPGIFRQGSNAAWTSKQPSRLAN